MTATSHRTEEEYARRMSAVLQLIDFNLEVDLPLARLASTANFSPFHFHRIFAAFVGETPAEYVRRLRLEKAANQLETGSTATITEIALACGFSTSALFCRLFKTRFGMSPSAWRESRKNRQSKRKNRKDNLLLPASQLRRRRQAMRKTPVVSVQDVPAIRVACVKHMKGYDDGEGIGKAFQALFSWAGPRGLLGTDMRVLGMPLDNPDVTPKDKCRYYACVAVQDRAEPEGAVSIMNIRSGRYAVARFKGSGDVFKKAYEWMYGEWLPGSGWQPDDAPAFESYVGEPGGATDKMSFTFDLYVPLKAL